MALRTLVTFISALFVAVCCVAQPRYQSLMWKISGNGLEKPSYLYGTMHISGKMVFHLGDQFYEAINEVDVVALELEPEAWLQAIFDDKSSHWYSRNDNWSTEAGFGYDYETDLPPLRGCFAMNTAIQDRVKDAMMYDPALLNYLLFRYGDYGYEADFEEDTWLDMYIYQTGKKLGKQTLGLETYQQSDYFIRQARQAERGDDERKEYDDGDVKEIRELQAQFEPAYRRQDLDLIDSLNKKTTSAAFDKYILVERNKVFIQTIDSALHAGKTVFAGMGCAHLPGKNGVIEMLRGLGYTVEPYNKGERNAKQRDKLEKLIYRRPYSAYKANDKSIGFSTPAPVYYLGADENSATWISLDIANGASFLVQRINSYAGLTGRDPENVLASIDSILYEAVAGDIVSQKRVNISGFPALDVVNKSRRGDYQRRLLVILPEEILLMKVTATSDKVRNGYANEFFASLDLSAQAKTNVNWVSPDNLVSCTMPGILVAYEKEKNEGVSADFEITSSFANDHSYFLVQRHSIYDPEFLDEDDYELNRLADAFLEDNHMVEASRRVSRYKGLPAITTSATNTSGKKVYTRFIIQNLNYHAFSAFSADSLKAEQFFSSIQFKRKDHAEFFSYEDTTTFFRVLLPYQPDDGDEEEDFDWYFDDNKDKNEFTGAAGNTILSPPGETDYVQVEFQRYHKFSDGEDSLKFYRDKENLVKGEDMHIEKKSIAWNEYGCEMNFLLSDTACSRKYMKKLVLYNKTLYTLSASYDSILGPGDFISKVYSSFEPADTNFAFYHFRNRDNAYLDALTSTDSTTKANAIGIISEMDFAASAAPRMRELLHHMPEIESQKDRELVKEKLTLGLSSDTSWTNLEFITGEFYKYTDSALYQVDLLRTLLRMKTRDSWFLYKKLLIDEPPIISGSNNPTGFALLSDSLELASKFIPDFMQLLALDEYQEAVYHLLAESLDSNLVKPDMYKTQVKQIVMEAKNELKRLNSTGELSYNFDTSTLLDYCTLLQPYRKDEDVKSFFDRAYRSKKMSLLLDLVDFDLAHRVNVPDSVYARIYSNEEEIIPLYGVLYDHKMVNKMPGKYRDRDSFITFYVKEKFKGKYGKEVNVDSVHVISRREENIRSNKLEVYYCKYRKAKSKQWMGIILAFDASDPANTWPYFIERSKTIVLDDDENELEELDREYKLLVESNRQRLHFSHGQSNKSLGY